MQFRLRTLLIVITYAAVSMGALAAASATLPSMTPAVLSILVLLGCFAVLLALPRMR